MGQAADEYLVEAKARVAAVCVEREHPVGRYHVHSPEINTYST